MKHIAYCKKGRKGGALNQSITRAPVRQIKSAHATKGLLIIIYTDGKSVAIAL